MDAHMTALGEKLDALAAAGFKMGAEWEALHEICQSHEGQQPFDAAHALCHRIEGDAMNARYWYRRAGRAPASGSFSEECTRIKTGLGAGG